jgi:hypothetical protein
VELGWLPREWYSKPVQQAIATGCDAFLPNKTTNSTSTNSGTNTILARPNYRVPRLHRWGLQKRGILNSLSGSFYWASRSGM